MQEYIDKISMCVYKGKVRRTSVFPPDMKGQDGADEIAEEALKNNIPPKVLLDACMTGMDRIGKDFSEHKVFITNLVVSAGAMNAVLKHLKPFLESGEVQRKGKFVIGTVAGDLHDIGKNLVSMIITGGGYEVIDLGADVSTQKFLDAIGKNPGCSVGLSALLTTTMLSMDKIVKTIKQTYPGMRVLIGGAPVNHSFCTQIGADFYSPNAYEAVDYLNKATA
ncbi:MAG TPA: cobalamin-dependent protein [Ignavibacteriaceae bacterium]|nr:cobalamin-dependent protein [Ignavibacteriaceae bacterium]